jgi:hypothetical protein
VAKCPKTRVPKKEIFGAPGLLELEMPRRAKIGIEIFVGFGAPGLRELEMPQRAKIGIEIFVGSQKSLTVSLVRDGFVGSRESLTVSLVRDGCTVRCCFGGGVVGGWCVLAISKECVGLNCYGPWW